MDVIALRLLSFDGATRHAAFISGIGSIVLARYQLPYFAIPSGVITNISAG